MPQSLQQELTAEVIPAALPQSRKSPFRMGTRFFLYATTILLSAFLLFQVQLIVGKLLLPLFGGTPAVWNACMMCFQTLLVLGYAYAHVIGKMRNPRDQGRVHAALLIASTVIVGGLWLKWGSPLTPGKDWRTALADNPVLKILELLGITAGLPFFLLSTTGPLLQKWLTLGEHKNSPYRLYALSNTGSLLGLVSYPFLIEWGLTLKHQAWVWGCSYLAFAILGVAVTRRLRDSDCGHCAAQVPALQPEQEAGTIKRAPYSLWLGLSACSTIMLLAATNLLCQDIAVIPLLWVVPLTLYLLSFILTFAGNRWYQRKIFWPLYFALLSEALKTSFDQNRNGLILPIVFCCATLFVVCMVCHGELARSKPEPRQLTGFYLMVALGGALGGVFVVLIAPNVFLGFWEYQVGLLGCGFLLIWAYAVSPSQNPGFGIWTIALILLLLWRQVTGIPLLWVVPVVLYALTSILAFNNNRWHEQKVFWPLYFGILGALITSTALEKDRSTFWLLALGCAALFLTGIALRRNLAVWKSWPTRAPGLNSLLALGGALGGVAIASMTAHLSLGIWSFRMGLLGCGLLLVAAYTLRKPVQDPEPKLWIVALVLLLASLVKQLGSVVPSVEAWLALRPAYYTWGFLASICLVWWWVAWNNKRKWPDALGDPPLAQKPLASLLSLGMLFILVQSSTPTAGPHVLFRERNFFGTKFVRDNADKLMLLSGNTVHGFEYRDAARRTIPTSYYREESGVGRVLRDYPRNETDGGSLRVGVVGMGAGTLAAYGHPGDFYRFYEIDPAVIALSGGARPYFHFLQDSPAKVSTVLGDARLSLENEAARGELQSLDVLVVDAFSSDSIPVHLLTREAMGIYLKHLRDRDGMLAFHVSNRYLDLDPVMVALASAYGLSAIEVQIPTSKWVLLCANPDMFRTPRLAEIATPVRLRKGPVLWTDDYSNLFQVLQQPGP